MTFIKRLPNALRQSAIYALALAGTKAISLAMVPIFTHYLTPADYGRLDILQTLADILSIIIGLGLADTLFRFCNDDQLTEARFITARLYGLSWMIAGVACVITQLSAPFIVQLLPGDITLLQTRLILASLSLSGTILVPLAWMRFKGQAFFFMGGTLGRTLFQAVLGALFLFLGFGVTGFITAGFIACLLLSFSLAIKQIRETGILFNLNAIRTYGPYGGPLIFAGFAGFILGSFDRLILADIVGTAVMAQYALAAKFGLITAVLIQPFDMWWHAKRFSMLQNNNGHERCAYFGTVAVLIVVGAVIIVCSISPLLITWLTPASYHQSILYVPFLVFFAGLHNLTQTLGFGIYTEKTTRLPAYIDGTAAAIALILYFTLIPIYGVTGAIIATFIALFLRFITTFVIAQKTCFLPYSFIKLLSLTGYGLCIIAIVTLNENIFLKVLIGSVGLFGHMILGLLLNILPYPKKLSSKQYESHDEKSPDYAKIT